MMDNKRDEMINEPENMKPENMHDGNPQTPQAPYGQDTYHDTYTGSDGYVAQEAQTPYGGTANAYAGSDTNAYIGACMDGYGTQPQQAQWTYYGASSYTSPPAGSSDDGKHKKKKEKGLTYITRKAFVLGLICCMLATSGITVGGLYAGGAFKAGGTGSGGTNTVSATNYTLAEASGSAKSIQEIVAMNQDAVVSITTESVATDSWMQNYVKSGAGSGVIIDSDGYVMTCNHVIDGASSITVTLRDGTEYPATVAGADSLSDIAVLRIDGTGFTAATYGNSDDLSVGDLAVAIGNPLGELGGTATTGIISALNRELTVDGKRLTLLQTDSSINPGNSGGGMFDQYGNLIGIVVAKAQGSDVEGLGFAIPINTAANIAKELIENGKVTGRAYIGVSIVDLTSADNAMQYGVRQTGIYIQEVTSDEARSAGFQAGDMIYYIGDTQIKATSDITDVLSEHKPGDEVTVTVIRNNSTVDITTTLVEG